MAEDFKNSIHPIYLCKGTRKTIYFVRESGANLEHKLLQILLLLLDFVAKLKKTSLLEDQSATNNNVSHGTHKQMLLPLSDI